MAGPAIETENVSLRSLIQDLREDPQALETASPQHEPQSETASEPSQQVAPVVSDLYGASIPQEQKPAEVKTTEPESNSIKPTISSIFLKPGKD